jgi:hypothetical protein
MEWTNLKIKVLINGAGSEISRPATSNNSFHNASAGKFISPEDVRPIPQKQNDLLPWVK